jgi:Domain of unknown function (DUF4881)
MKKSHLWLIILMLFIVPLLIGCGEMGRVDQGRVVAYDATKKEVTIIQDKKGEAGKPDYDTLPPHVYAMPTDPHETGAEPKPGKRMNLDTQKKVITIFDPVTTSFKKIDYTLIDQKEGVGKDSPLVEGKEFPQVDRNKRTITIYSGRQRVLTTFTVPEEYFSLPDDTWTAGDEVRIYYHQPGKAQRFMNITRTDIFKK